MHNGKGTACLRDEKSKLTYKEKEATLALSQSSASSQAKAYVIKNGIPLTLLWQPPLAVWSCLGKVEGAVLQGDMRMLAIEHATIA